MINVLHEANDIILKGKPGPLLLLNFNDAYGTSKFMKEARETGKKNRAFNCKRGYSGC